MRIQFSSTAHASRILYLMFKSSRAYKALFFVWRSIPRKGEKGVGLHFKGDALTSISALALTSQKLCASYGFTYGKLQTFMSFHY